MSKPPEPIPQYWSVYFRRQTPACPYRSEMRITFTLRADTLEKAIEGARAKLHPTDNDFPWMVMKVIPVDGPEGA